MKKSKSLLLAGLIGLLLLCLGNQLTLVRKFPNFSTATGAFVASQVDTVSYAVEGSEQALGFFVHPGDSVSITNVIVRRVVNSKMLGTVAGDTIIGAVIGRSDTLIYAAAAVTPICQTMKFIVTYASSAQGVTTPTVNYDLLKRY